MAENKDTTPYTCPKCGKDCGSLAGFHTHWKKEHGGK